MYSTHNEEKSVVAERFIRTLKAEFISIWLQYQNMGIDKLDYIVNKYNNTYYRLIKMKPADVKSSTYIDSSKEFNDEYPKFNIGDIFRISRYKAILTKGFTLNWSEKVLLIKKVKSTMPVDSWS